MFDTQDLKTESRSGLKRTATKLQKNIEKESFRKLPFKPRNKIRLYNSNRKIQSSLYIPRIYMRSFSEGATPVVTLNGAGKFKFPQITTTAQLASLMKKDKRLQLSKDKQYVLCYQSGKRYPIYQINTSKNTKSLESVASKEFADMQIE